MFTILFFTFNLCYGQIYQRTRKATGVQLNSHLFTHFEREVDDFKFSNQDVGVSVLRMVLPGLFFKANYNHLSDNLFGKTSQREHFFSAGVGLDKFLFNFPVKNVHTYCVYYKAGLLSELNYGFVRAPNNPYRSRDEVNLKVGLSMHTYIKNMSKKSKGRSLHWEFYYQYGFSLFFKSSNSNYSRNGVGVQLRIMKHQTVNFLK